MKRILAIALGLALVLTAVGALAEGFQFSSGSGTDTTGTDTTLPADGGTQPTQAPAADPTPTPEPEGPVVRYGMTNAKGVNIRAKANTKSDIVTKLAITGSPFVIIEDEDVSGQVWYKIEIDEETEGYIRGDLADVIDETAYRAAGGTYFPFPTTAAQTTADNTGTTGADTTPTGTGNTGSTGGAGTGSTSNAGNTPGSNALNVIPGFGAGPDESANTGDGGEG